MLGWAVHQSDKGIVMRTPLFGTTDNTCPGKKSIIYPLSLDFKARHPLLMRSSWFLSRIDFTKGNLAEKFMIGFGVPQSQ